MDPRTMLSPYVDTTPCLVRIYYMCMFRRHKAESRFVPTTLWRVGKGSLHSYSWQQHFGWTFFFLDVTCPCVRLWPNHVYRPVWVVYYMLYIVWSSLMTGVCVCTAVSDHFVEAWATSYTLVLTSLAVRVGRLLFICFLQVNIWRILPKGWVIAPSIGPTRQLTLFFGNNFVKSHPKTTHL